MRKLTLILLSILSLPVFGQGYKYEASIDTINNNGFYKILLSPHITSKLNSQFADIRLYKTNNSYEVPYLLVKEGRVKEKELFVEYKIIEKKHIKAYKYTRIVIQNSAKNSINNIVLRISNSDVRKRLKLNASYDNKQWYVLKDNYDYNSIASDENTTEIRVLNFPASNYEFYELLVDDYYDKPINIIQAGYYNRVHENGKYSALSNRSFSCTDTLKETTIAIPVQANYIDKISFSIDSPKYYLREAELYTKQKIIQHKKVSVINNTIAFFKLISNSENSFALNNIQADTLFVKIKNNDNEPLLISDIKLYQLNKYLVAELESKEQYYLKFSDKQATKPVYDLKYFADSIPAELKVIRTHSPHEIGTTQQDKVSQNIDFKNYWLWIIIIAVALLLAYMSIKMVRENAKS